MVQFSVIEIKIDDNDITIIRRPEGNKDVFCMGIKEVYPLSENVRINIDHNNLEYECIEDIKEELRILKSGNKQILEEMHWLVGRNSKLTNLLETASEDMKTCYGMDTELTDEIKSLLNNDLIS